MDKEWFYKLPDFQNKSEWIEVEPQSYFFDPVTNNVLRCKLGVAPEKLLIGMVILKVNSANSKLFLLEYRDVGGRGPYVLKWWDGNNTERLCGIAVFSKNGWRVKSEFQNFIWDITYDEEEKFVKKVLPILAPIPRRMSN